MVSITVRRPGSAVQLAVEAAEFGAGALARVAGREASGELQPENSSRKKLRSVSNQGCEV